MALYKFTSPLVMLFEKYMANSSQGGNESMTHGVDETKEMAEIEAVHDNVVVLQEVVEEAQQACAPQTTLA